MSAVLNQQGLDAARLDARAFTRRTPHSRRLDEGPFILYCSSYRRSIRQTFVA
ncbi:hypothetical protein KCP74_03960 [Salmonella enterica subsp. enterica]|nr:hypothetical protein KCP74_03960 [Salmonella enterica subsp. enterica]